MSFLAPKVNNLLELIGGTPLIQLRHLPGPDAADVLGKCEQYNPGGSVKDRIALSMIEDAERAGRITPGLSTIVEPTSGNTGIGLALVCAVKGYKLVLTMPESMSLERRSLLKAYGAELILTPAERTMEGAVEMAEELCKSRPHHFMPQQFRNPANPDAHRRTTARELLAQTQGRPIDALVSAVGTGGTITGVGEVLREHFPKVRIIAVEPQGSPVLSGGKPGPHKIQGIGAGFVPEVLNRSIIDEVRTVPDRVAYQTKVALANREGLLVGISAGAAVAVACDVARELGPGKLVVTFLCDTGERYFSLDEYFA
ncbi:MAG TPA: cysteine synthase A [Polyangia bacterium]|jgi:cysteine synthase A|nr:cysteine synthase A [Polyangia bacterium]